VWWPGEVERRWWRIWIVEEGGVDAGDLIEVIVRMDMVAMLRARIFGNGLKRVR
jgi:hypothetical protein